MAFHDMGPQQVVRNLYCQECDMARHPITGDALDASLKAVWLQLDGVQRRAVQRMVVLAENLRA